jgi:hypothetical protein
VRIRESYLYLDVEAEKDQLVTVEGSLYISDSGSVERFKTINPARNTYRRHPITTRELTVAPTPATLSGRTAQTPIPDPVTLMMSIAKVKDFHGASWGIPRST